MMSPSSSSGIDIQNMFEMFRFFKISKKSKTVFLEILKNREMFRKEPLFENSNKFVHWKQTIRWISERNGGDGVRVHLRPELASGHHFLLVGPSSRGPHPVPDLKFAWLYRKMENNSFFSDFWKTFFWKLSHTRFQCSDRSKNHSWAFLESFEKSEIWVLLDIARRTSFKILGTSFLCLSLWKTQFWALTHFECTIFGIIQQKTV